MQKRTAWLIKFDRVVIPCNRSYPLFKLRTTVLQKTKIDFMKGAPPFTVLTVLTELTKSGNGATAPSRKVRKLIRGLFFCYESATYPQPDAYCIPDRFEYH